MILDRVFQATVERRPRAIALADDTRSLDYAACAHAVASIAGRLESLGLAPGAAIGIQLPNTIDGVVSLLAVLRAGLVAVPLPLLWRAEASAALKQICAQAVIGADTAMSLASSTFTVRYACGYGESLPDGMVRLDAPDDAGTYGCGPPRAGGRIVTFEMMPPNAEPIWHEPADIVTAGLDILGAHALPAGATILTAMLGGSWGGLASAIGPWLVTGGTLVLHQPFDAEGCAKLCAAWPPEAMVLPGPVASCLIEAGLVPEEATVMAIWRQPERGRFAAAPKRATLDLLALGEGALVALPLRESPALQLTDRGTLAVRRPDGRMCDTRWPGRRNSQGELTSTGPPAGSVAVGGYRLDWAAVQNRIARIDPGATLIALPHAVMGHRLAGASADAASLRSRLAREGAIELLWDAFEQG